MLVQRLPTDVSQVMFKAVQTYSDGTVVRWIDPVDSAHPNPEHPGPVLALTADATATTPTTAAAGSPAATVDASNLARKTSVDGARTLGLIGVAVGALGLALAAAALAMRRRASGTPDQVARSPVNGGARRRASTRRPARGPGTGLHQGRG